MSLHKKFIADCYKRLEVSGRTRLRLVQTRLSSVFLKSRLRSSGGQLCAGGADFDARCYEGNQNADGHRHADCSHICTITIQVCADFLGLKESNRGLD